MTMCNAKKRSVQCSRETGHLGQHTCWGVETWGEDLPPETIELQLPNTEAMRFALQALATYASESEATYLMQRSTEHACMLEDDAADKLRQISLAMLDFDKAVSNTLKRQPKELWKIL